jgi:hypothetical protein
MLLLVATVSIVASPDILTLCSAKAESVKRFPWPSMDATHHALAAALSGFETPVKMLLPDLNQAWM